MSHETITRNYDAEFRFAGNLADDAGDMIVEGFRKVQNVVWKPDNTPLTETDKAINKLTIERVQSAFPDHGVLGEEKSFEPNRDKLWVVDPIDGTQPFSLKIPTNVFSLAYVEDGDVKVGFVKDPYAKQTYWATKNEGAFVDGKPLVVSHADGFKENYVVLSSHISGEGRATIGQLFDKIQDQRGKVFDFRSIVYGFMLVASGHAVASVAGYIKPWDLAAAKVILEEAGATVTDFDNNPIKYNDIDNGVVVSNGKVHEQILNLING